MQTASVTTSQTALDTAAGMLTGESCIMLPRADEPYQTNIARASALERAASGHARVEGCSI